jgi:UNC-6/NTR/C345C module
MLQDETSYVFRGKVVALSSSSSTNEYTIRIEKVYKNGCLTTGNSSSITLSERQMISLVSARDSCGFPKLATSRTYLIAGYGDTVSDSNGNNRSRLLQHEQELSMMHNTTSHALRRRDASAMSTVIMDIYWCSGYIDTWLGVTQKEKNLLSKEYNTVECSGD